MSKGEWIVDIIDPGCGCCSYLYAESFDTKKEAVKYIASQPDPKNFTMYFEEDDE